LRLTQPKIYDQVMAFQYAHDVRDHHGRDDRHAHRDHDDRDLLKQSFFEQE